MHAILKMTCYYFCFEYLIKRVYSDSWILFLIKSNLKLELFVYNNAKTYPGVVVVHLWRCSHKLTVVREKRECICCVYIMITKSKAPKGFYGEMGSAKYIYRGSFSYKMWFVYIIVVFSLVLDRIEYVKLQIRWHYILPQNQLKN